MTRRHRPAGIALISALVVIGVAILAAGVPFVVGTLWVILVAVAVLVTWWLVLNPLGGAAPNTHARSPRIMVLAIIGVALLAAGMASVLTLWISSFARFMLLEDLGVDGTTAAAVARVTPVDRGLFMFGGILAVLGAAALIAVAALARHRGRAGRR